MRFGDVLDEHWEGRDRFAHGADTRTPLPLPDDVECYAMAATRSPETARTLASDGLVSVDSALGGHPDPRLTLAFPQAHQCIGFGMSHLDLLSRADVYATLRRWLAT